jgi:hypothetical protein
MSSHVNALLFVASTVLQQSSHTGLRGLGGGVGILGLGGGVGILGLGGGVGIAVLSITFVSPAI